jgi:hypothetical protein
MDPCFVDVTQQALGHARSRTPGRCCAAPTTGARSSMAPAGSTFTATTAWRWVTSTMTALTISMSASHPGCPTGSTATAAMGRFEDVTEKAGVGVLDNTACALFADFENKGRQDLLVVCGSGPCSSQIRATEHSRSSAMPSSSRVLPRERSPMRLWPTTIATDVSISTSACTATTWASISITTRFPISTPGMARQFSVAQRRQWDVCRPDQSGRIERRERPLQFRLRLGPLRPATDCPICMWPTISGAPTCTATMATAPSALFQRGPRGGCRRRNERLLV